MLGNTQAVTTTPYSLDKEVLTANKDTIDTHLDTTDKDPENEQNFLFFRAESFQQPDVQPA